MPDGVDKSLFGMPKESDWVLYAPYTDKTLMRNVLAYDFQSPWATGRPAVGWWKSYSMDTMLVSMYSWRK